MIPSAAWLTFFPNAATRPCDTGCCERSRLVDEPTSSSLIYYETGKRKRKAHATWYRGETTNFYPDKANIAKSGAVDEYVGKGWFPPAPFITKDHYITAFGSCFASEVTKFLYREGYQVFGRDMTLNSYVVRSGEGIVNTAAIRQQFEWAFEGKTPNIELWHDKAGVPATIPKRSARRRGRSSKSRTSSS